MDCSPTGAPVRSFLALLSLKLGDREEEELKPRAQDLYNPRPGEASSSSSSLSSQPFRSSKEILYESI